MAPWTGLDGGDPIDLTLVDQPREKWVLVRCNGEIPVPGIGRLYLYHRLGPGLGPGDIVMFSADFTQRIA